MDELSKKEQKQIRYAAQLLLAEPYLKRIIRTCQSLTAGLVFINKGDTSVLARLKRDISELRVTARAALKQLEDLNVSNNLPGKSVTSIRPPPQISKEDKHKDQEDSCAGGRPGSTGKNGDREDT